MNVYLEEKDIPKSCTACPFVSGDDACVLQDEHQNFNADTWDDLKKGCPLMALSVAALGGGGDGTQL